MEQLATITVPVLLTPSALTRHLAGLGVKKVLTKLSIVQTCVPKVRMTGKKIYWKGCERKTSWPDLKHRPGICLRILSKTKQLSKQMVSVNSSEARTSWNTRK
jgi:hypothetical protein